MTRRQPEPHLGALSPATRDALARALARWFAERDRIETDRIARRRPEEPHDG